MFKPNTAKNIALNALEVIKVYCLTMEASGYSYEELVLLRSEFEPILNECDKTIKKLEAL